MFALQILMVRVKFWQLSTVRVRLPAVEKLPVEVPQSVAVDDDANLRHHSARYGRVPPVAKLVQV